jgi:hypothetical protein
MVWQGFGAYMFYHVDELVRIKLRKGPPRQTNGVMHDIAKASPTLRGGERQKPLVKWCVMSKDRKVAYEGLKPFHSVT